MPKNNHHKSLWQGLPLAAIALLLTVLGSETGLVDKIWGGMSTRSPQQRNRMNAIALAFQPRVPTKNPVSSSPVAQTTEPVTREVLAKGKPAGEPCQVLELVRYTIDPEIILPAHTHPGMQISKIVSGEITYFVVKGEVEITQTDGSVKILKSGEQIKLHSGDSVVEPGGVVHFGQNHGSEPVVLLSSSLFPCDAPFSEVVE